MHFNFFFLRGLRVLAQFLKVKNIFPIAYITNDKCNFLVLSFSFSFYLFIFKFRGIIETLKIQIYFFKKILTIFIQNYDIGVLNFFLKKFKILLKLLKFRSIFFFVKYKACEHFL